METLLDWFWIGFFIGEIGVIALVLTGVIKIGK